MVRENRGAAIGISRKDRGSHSRPGTTGQTRGGNARCRRPLCQRGGIPARRPGRLPTGSEARGGPSAVDRQPAALAAASTRVTALVEALSARVEDVRHSLESSIAAQAEKVASVRTAHLLHDRRIGTLLEAMRRRDSAGGDAVVQKEQV